MILGLIEGGRCSVIDSEKIKKGFGFDMRKLALIFSISLVVLLSACGAGTSKDSIDVITFADAGWDSIRFHKSIAQRIVEDGYVYDPDVTNGPTAATLRDLRHDALHA